MGASARRLGSYAGALALAASLSAPVRAQAQAEEASPAPARSLELRTLRAATPDRGFGEVVAGFVSQSLFFGNHGTAGGSIFIETTDVGARLGIGGDARVRFDWGVAWSRSRSVGTVTTATMSEAYDELVDRTEARNADFALEWGPWVGTNARVLLGVGAAIPVAALASFGNANNGGMSTGREAATVDASVTTHSTWLAMNAAWAPWRYQPDRIAAFVPLGLFFDVGAVELGLEGALAVGFPVIGSSGGPDGATSVAAQISGAPLPELALGARVSLSVFSIGSRSEGAQPALEPFVRLDLRPLSLTLRGVVNLGSSGGSSGSGAGLGPPPFGVGSPNGVWAVHVGIALALDPEPEAE